MRHQTVKVLLKTKKQTPHQARGVYMMAGAPSDGVDQGRLLGGGDS